MEVVLLQILQWILRIILFIFVFLLGLLVVIMVVPIRYQAKGQYIEKEPGMEGRITWLCYLIYVKFKYEEEFRYQLRIFGYKMYDSTRKEKSDRKVEDRKNDEVQKGDSTEDTTLKKKVSYEEEIAEDWKETKNEEYEKTKIPEGTIPEGEKEAEDVTTGSGNEKRSWSEKIEDIQNKCMDLIRKMEEIKRKLQDGKLQIEHYMELWNRKETQITFQRSKKKFGRMLKAILPRKWEITGNIGFSNPATTGRLMGALGAAYPILGNRVKVVPDFENEILDIEGNVKGHIRLGNAVYQLISLLCNRHCVKFIKLIFDELGSSKKKKEK